MLFSFSCCHGTQIRIQLQINWVGQSATYTILVPLWKMRQMFNFQIAATHPFLELRKKGRKNSSGKLFKISFVSNNIKSQKAYQCLTNTATTNVYWTSNIIRKCDIKDLNISSMREAVKKTSSFLGLIPWGREGGLIFLNLMWNFGGHCFGHEIHIFILKFGQNSPFYS